MKRLPILLTGLTVLGSLFIFSPIAFADSNFSGCDEVDPGSWGTAGLSFLGQFCSDGSAFAPSHWSGEDGTPVVLSSSLTLYGITADSIGTAPTFSIGVGPTANMGSGDVCENIGSTLPGTQTFTFPTPVNFSSGQSIWMEGYSDSGCSVGAQVFLQQYASGMNASTGGMVLNFSSGSAVPSYTTPISIDVPLLYSTTTSPFEIQFTYNVASTSWVSDPSSLNQDPVLSGYQLTFRNSLSLVNTVLYGSLPDVSPGVHIATTTVSLSASGTYYATVALTNWTSILNPNALRFTYPDVTGAVDYFGINYNDAIQTITTSTSTCEAVASSSQCAVFSGTFDFGSCASYLLVPNSCSFDDYSQLPSSLAGRFPFAYVASIGSTWGSLQASTTLNSPTYSLNLHDLGIGSTSSIGNVLPNFVFFSASTTEQDFPPGTFDILKGLAGIAIILETIWWLWGKLHSTVKV